VPSEGYVIDFPFISQIYENHTENRVGPWALGLGFSPFPLDEINDALGQLKLRFPPSVNELANLPCYVPSAESILACTKGSQFGYAGACVDSISLDCKASGEKDSSGNDIYKVIRLLGTSHDDVPQDALDGLRQSFPGFSWP
jgi:hypothetical protein